MTDDRFSPEENPPVPTPCRRWVEPPKPAYVTADEVFAWLDDFERKFGLGKYATKKPEPAPPPPNRGPGQFGDEQENGNG